MATWKDLLISTLKLTDEVKRLDQETVRLSEKTANLSDRVVRLETIYEMSGRHLPLIRKDH